MKKRKHRLHLIFQLTCLYILLGGLLLPPLVRRHLEIRDARKIAGRDAVSEFTRGNPSRLVIPRIGVNIPVARGGYNKKTWDLSPDKALFAEGTAEPNNRSGNTLIYGHNTGAVFLKTSGLAKGDLALVYTDDDRIFLYTYQDDRLVRPTDVSVFNYTGNPRLTLLTCNGFLNENRRLMFFKFTKVV